MPEKIWVHIVCLFSGACELSRFPLLFVGSEPFDVWNVLGLSEESSRVPCLVGKRRKELVSNLHIIWEGGLLFSCY